MIDKKYICVSFDGVDLAGKTSTILNVKAILLKEGYSVKIFKDFTDNEIRFSDKKSIISEIRKAVLDNNEYYKLPMNLNTLLFTIARLKMITDIKEYIRLNINDKSDKPLIILLDRYVHSTLAYQINMGEDPTLVTFLCKYAVKLFKTDLSVLLDIDYETYENRKANRKTLDKIESVIDKNLFENIRKSFLDYFIFPKDSDNKEYVNGTIVINNNSSTNRANDIFNIIKSIS